MKENQKAAKRAPRESSTSIGRIMAVKKFMAMEKSNCASTSDFGICLPVAKMFTAVFRVPIIMDTRVRKAAMKPYHWSIIFLHTEWKMQFQNQPPGPSKRPGTCWPLESIVQ